MRRALALPLVPVPITLGAKTSVSAGHIHCDWFYELVTARCCQLPRRAALVRQDPEDIIVCGCSNLMALQHSAGSRGWIN